jgi:hypothetical protein
VNGGFRLREALWVRIREDERRGTLPGGMLYILEMLMSGDGVLLEGRPRCADLAPLLSMLVFLSGSLFSASRASILGRLDAMEGLRDRSTREVLRGKLLSEINLCGIVSAKLGSVISRISDRGRAFAHEVALLEFPLGSLKLLATMPPKAATSEAGDGGYEGLSSEGRDSDGGPFPGDGCE